ncbi:helix-turn-helix transcriptional regulator [Cohnella thailandensis]|uniref:Helix-turn-helix domain-containing protein n=1 Tax=Cohnella thailandensis TaxID=557557 RepID=A0A841SYZ6_9BACL|nr:helix-turn-helix transcriptional regulator [Cohnella thailandensis]MBB6635060.1 helix-turn-helix domain-containing protein [Cohnella thailandensis]MBP1975716.1 transcriptional regulator with XRE-family HTH domain [Cohnella thailandensis]
MEASSKERLQELAQFLRTRRARIRPEQAGLPGDGRRRTPGLRRGEVAMLAGISADWYTWLEQARPIQVSAQVLESLSRALELDSDERKHLFLLALQQLPADSALPENSVPPLLQAFLDGQGTNPAYVTDPRLNIVAWNKAASTIYGDYERMSPRERNSLWRTFTSPYVREMLRENWENHARHRLAHFRANYGQFPGDPWWMELIGDLSRASAEFREWWPMHDVLNGPEGRKINHHPTAGRLVFDQISFLVSDAPHLTVTINLPANEDDTPSKLARLLSGEA